MYRNHRRPQSKPLRQDGRRSFRRLRLEPLESRRCPAGLPPIAGDDSLVLPQNSSAPVCLICNDLDADSSLDPNSIVITQQPSHGTLAPAGLAIPGFAIYTPHVGYFGPDTFAYTVSDFEGNISNTAAVTVSVELFSNQAPVAQDDLLVVQTNASGAVCWLCNDFDPEGNLDPTSIEITRQPLFGTLTTFPMIPPPFALYVPQPGYLGPDSFAYTVRDLDGAVSNQAVVHIDVRANQPPIAADDWVVASKGAAALICLVCNDVDPENLLDPQTITITRQPTFGTLRTFPDAPPGFAEYVPNSGYVGQDSFGYTVRDLSGATSNEATVQITVQPNDPPMAANDAASTFINQPVPINVLANDSDPDGDPIGVAMFTQPLHGSLAPSPFSDTLTYFPNIDFVGTDTFTYAVRDPSGALSNVATVTIEVTAIKLIDNGSGGMQLSVFGTSHRDSVRIERQGNRLVVHARLALPPGPADNLGSRQKDGQVAAGIALQQTFPLSGVQSIVVLTGAGNDSLHMDERVRLSAFVDGGDGDDWLRTGGGDDSVFDLAGNNRIETGDGQDFVFTNFGSNRIDAGKGDDRIRAGDGADIIDAGPGSDVVRGGRGNDVVEGGLGNDILLGDDGNDVLAGGAGRDIVIGGYGADLIFGNAGDDILIAGWTLYDLDDLALLSLLAEWDSNDGYSQRVAKLTGDLASGFRLSGEASPLQTVFEDSDTDLLSGQLGRDLFFSNRHSDREGSSDCVLDQDSNETWIDVFPQYAGGLPQPMVTRPSDARSGL